MTAWKLYLAILVVGASLGLTAGWGLWHPAKAPVETAQPAVRQADSSLELRRAPDAHATPTAIVPKGQHVARIENITVQPAAPIIVHDTVAIPGEPGKTVVKVDTVRAPPVRVQLTLTDLADGTHRVIASSPDGRVLDSLSVDIAVKNTAPPRVLKNALGVAKDLVNGPWSAVYARELLGPVSGLVELQPKQGIVPWAGKLGLMIRF